MKGSGIGPAKLHQIALAGGDDLGATLVWWNDMLGLPTHARFEPPGIAFIYLGEVRLIFTPGGQPATVYLLVSDLDGSCEQLGAKGAAFISAPQLIHVDTSGQFGPAGNEEWMAFLRDPAGNTIALAERRLPAPA